jgi:hypothetical protein
MYRVSESVARIVVLQSGGVFPAYLPTVSNLVFCFMVSRSKVTKASN